MEQMIEVPLRLIEELSRYAEAADTKGERVLVPENGHWSRSNVHGLKDECRSRGYTGALEVGDAAAATPGVPVLIHDIATSVLHKRQIQSDLGAMSKAAVRLFGRKVWPWRALDSNAGMTYLMQPKIAEWWNEA